jgi:hypothetical protein
MAHLMEFMDQEWLPRTLRATLREILDCGNSRPFRPYNSWVAGEVIRSAEEGAYRRVVELGAGTAPITRAIAKKGVLDSVHLVPCDRNPDITLYVWLQKRFPGQIAPLYEEVDFSRPRRWPDRTLLVISAALHHVPPDERRDVLTVLVESADRVMIFEPLRRTALSALFVLLSLVPAVLLPIMYAGKPGRLRRILWCWLLPVAPMLFIWDGVVSAVRQWTGGEWDRELQFWRGEGVDGSRKTALFSHLIVLERVQGVRTPFDKAAHVAERPSSKEGSPLRQRVRSLVGGAA